VLESQKFILDHEVSEFEREIAAYTTTAHAAGCASGTDAILLSLLGLGIGKGDEVITSAFSFFSTAGMIAWLQATPVFVDVDPVTFNLRTEQVAERITSNTKAIVAVHLFGQCCRMEDLTNLGVPVIEDACQSLGAERNGRRAGSMGATGCFSFYPTKNLGGYGDGGEITTNDERLYSVIKQLRAHGSSVQYHHDRVGTNSRLDEIQAAILRAKFKHLDQWNKKRNENAAAYFEQLDGVPLKLPEVEKGNTSIFHQFVIRTPDRDNLRNFLIEHEIGTAIYYPVPLHLQPCFSSYGYKKGDYPDAEECANTSLALPIYPELTKQQIEYVSSTIWKFFGKTQA
jgi:dTDP-4-amino-4,6-dideoxygalactose transaminase